MPILVEWKWIEKTETFLVVFHFWDDSKQQNLRMRILEQGFETLALVLASDQGTFEKGEENTVAVETAPYYELEYPKTKAYLSWAPSHAQFCLLTEVLTYANLINGLKPDARRKLKLPLQGKMKKEEHKGKNEAYFLIDYDLLTMIGWKKAIVSFSSQNTLSFEVCLEYVEYLRKLIKPHM